MKALLSLHHIRVENANAIAGMTYGFPAISSFLGFTHALSRVLQQEHGLQLGGCAVVCHQTQVHAYQPGGWGDFSFAQTRNPLTRDEKSPPFIEEGRMQMEVSMVMECDFYANDLEFGSGDAVADIERFETYILHKVQALRLAGGSIIGLRHRKPVTFEEVPEEYADLEKFRNKLTRRLLPGFVLVDRIDLLYTHWQHLRSSQPQTELLDAWLDFIAIKHTAPQPEQADGKVVWQRQAKPGTGWLVPLSVGYQAISPLYPAAQVGNARDRQTPFRFVESAYSIGQWLSPHRITDLEHLFWRYQVEGDLYLCNNNYRAPQPEQAETLNPTLA